MGTLEKMISTAEPPVRWNLTALFSSIDDPKIEETWTQLSHEADQIEHEFRGKIDSPDLTPATLLKGILAVENLTNEAAKAINYANLLYSAETSNPKLGAFFAKQMEHASATSVKIMFFELELQAADPAVIDRCLADPSLDKYRHFVNQARLLSPYRLSEKEEIILEETANTGCRAWERLFEEVTANQVYKFENPQTHEVEELSQEDVISKLRSADRNVRVAAFKCLSEGLKSMERILTFTFNNLIQDKAVDDRLRAFDFPEQARHFSNELESKTVDLVMKLCGEHYPQVERFYRVKREIMGLPELTHVDRYATLAEAEQSVTFPEAKSIVMDSFGAFSPTIRDKAKEFFDQSWIDAEPRPGKQGGAYCCYNTPDTHPVVFMSYLGKSDDVMTLAHELGHGAHASLSRVQSYFNFSGTLPLAECASTFGEMLVFENLVSKASKKDQLAMYAEKLEGIFGTIFRQAAMYKFEGRIHRKRREEGELTAEEFGDIWQEEMQAMFGDSVKLGDEHRCFWSYISHFIASPFYVYAYSFGELLVLSLFDRAKAEGQTFEPKYVAMLQKGGSETPQELMGALGVDLDSPDFWQGGFHAIERLLTQFEAIWADLKPTWTN